MSDRISRLLDRINFSRHYVLSLIGDIPTSDWYRMPVPGLTHLAWQIGHLAVVEQRLVFQRVIGLDDEFRRLVPESYGALFGKGSTPTAEGNLPAPEEILKSLHAIHAAVNERLPQLDESILDEATDPPHPAFSDKAGSLRWCAEHELTHAGQIGLLRRMLGHRSLR